MTLHTHSEFVEGCYRCDLGRDELLPQERCGFCVLGKIVRPGPDGRPDGYTYPCPFCDGTGFVQ